MARVSRKAAISGEGKRCLAVIPERIYNVAAYVRLSVEGDNLEKNRESISTQRYMLEKYIEKQPDMRLTAVFCDNGETGTDFERPGFEKMMDEVRHRKIDCIVVKDDCVIKARTPQPLENRHFLRISAKFRAILRPQRTAHIIGNS